ncbi:MAG: DUF2971 domain-containing protein [Betaproteobacteria bacterium]|nr:DUF2971 domain-containing protein [Betaproteobacteria bacterium]
MGKVSEEKPLLYHYTNAAGLTGIITSQKIYATSIAYLNDAEEQIGYLKRRLPVLLSQWTLDALKSQLATTPHSVECSEEEIRERAADISQRLHSGIMELSLELDDPYIASFSAPPRTDPNDGLLSQWRGYGQDGGYAIVFETTGIESLLELESKAFHHQTLLLCDVDYHYDGSSEHGTPLPETLEDEHKVQDAIRQFVVSGARELLEQMYQPLVQLSIRSKHRGFQEESEVRIAALRSVPRVWREEKRDGEARPQKELFFRPRSGLLIPYVKLFGTSNLGRNAVLPIRKVIVGPHPDKTKRRESVERLLQQHGIAADVIESSIPYLGY